MANIKMTDVQMQIVNELIESKFIDFTKEKEDLNTWECISEMCDLRNRLKAAIEKQKKTESPDVPDFGKPVKNTAAAAEDSSEHNMDKDRGRGVEVRMPEERKTAIPSFMPEPEPMIDPIAPEEAMEQPENFEWMMQ